MNYKKITIPVKSPVKEVLIALLADAEYDGFEENDEELYTYIDELIFDEDELKNITDHYQLRYTTEDIHKINWNQQWEANFEPVIVENICTIRADFHDLFITTPYEIIINPKMSFGTGHHATTQLMIEAMYPLHFEGKNVLDFGCGTGILGIFASQLGAASVLGIDHEDWACENAKENTARNDIHNIEIRQGSLEQAPAQYDIILANINRHILLHYMELLFDKLAQNGILLMSGVLKEDEDILKKSAAAVGFQLVKTERKGNWLMMEVKK